VKNQKIILNRLLNKYENSKASPQSWNIAQKSYAESGKEGAFLSISTKML